MLQPEQLHDYQKKAVEFQCTHPATALWLDMGLGKTAITLTSMVHLLNTGFLRGVLIVAPIRVIRLVWRQEAMKWSHTKHLKFSMVAGTKDQRTRALMQDADVYLINYENLKWMGETLHTYYTKKGRPFPFNGLVWDELSKMKNSATNRVKAVRKILPEFDWKTGLTGTPAANGYKDLHGQFLVLDEGQRLGTAKTAFRERFYYKISQYKDAPYPDTEETIKNLIGDITLEMSAEDYNPLPDMIVNDVMLEFDKATRGHYDALEKQFFTQLDNGTEIEVFNAAALTNKCLAEGTEVLTLQRGWIPIEQYSGEYVWDGVEWVSTSGLAFNGYKYTINCYDVLMTPDHKVLTEDGWKEAGEITDGESPERHDRAKVRPPDGCPTVRQCKNTREVCSGDVVMPMRLRHRGSAPRSEFAQSQQAEGTQELRLHGRKVEQESRNDQLPTMGFLAQHGISVSQPERQRLQKLRCAWHRGLRKVAQLFRGVLGGHGSDLQGSFDFGTHEQHGELLCRELSLAVNPATIEQSQNEHLFANPHRTNHRRSGGEAVQYQTGDHLRSVAARVVRYRGNRVRRVYDLVNAGPRHRFTVRGGDGQPLIVHNCLQVANGAAYPVAGMPLWEPIHDLKLDALEDIIEEAAGQPVLCSYAYRADAERIMDNFKHLKPINLTDCKSESSLMDAMARWKSGDCPLMIGHPACLSGDTQVYTERGGWTKITHVTLDDRVFDGVEFVSHDGCSYSGYKQVVDVFGITMTPDHKLMIDGNWVEARHVDTSEEVRRKAVYRGEIPDTSISVMRPMRSRTENASQKEHVYDLVNCGPRNRFLIRNNQGEVFISHNSMGHGVDGLQDRGHILVWFGLNWSLDLYEQFNARIRRQGQGVPVICHRLLVNGTLDQAQAIALDDKATAQSGLRKAIKAYRQMR